MRTRVRSIRAPIASRLALAATTVLFVGPVGGGCVTKAKHDDLQRQLDAIEVALRNEQEAERRASSEQLQAKERRIESQQDSLDDARREVGTLQEALATADATIAELEHRLERSDREIAEMLKRKAAMTESLEEMSAALEELRARQLAADRAVAEYRSLLERFAKLIDAGKLRVKVIDGRLVLALPMDILFASGQAELTEEGRVSLLEVGRGLSTIPDRSFQVEGHTDDVPINTKKFPSNWELGAARALVVLRALEEGGVRAEQLSAATYGETRPTASNETPRGRAENRRIEIVVVPDLSGLPGYDELNRLGAGK